MPSQNPMPGPGGRLVSLSDWSLGVLAVLSTAEKAIVEDILGDRALAPLLMLEQRTSETGRLYVRAAFAKVAWAAWQVLRSHGGQVREEVAGFLQRVLSAGGREGDTDAAEAGVVLRALMAHQDDPVEFQRCVIYPPGTSVGTPGLALAAVHIAHQALRTHRGINQDDTNSPALVGARWALMVEIMQLTGE